jgi:serine protease Do
MATVWLADKLELVMATFRRLDGTSRTLKIIRVRSLASIAIVAVLVSGATFAGAEQTTPPANAGLTTTYANSGYADLVAAVKPAVVNVPEMDPEMRRFFERFFGEPGMPMPQQPPGQHVRGEGSGFVISPDGLVVTNAHVAGGADKITVLLDDGRELEGTLKGVDEKTDLALVKVDAGKPLPYVTFGDSSKVRVGDTVIAVGNPFGLGGTVTAGIVSATDREIGSGPYDDFLQVDAPINRGNSGGPTFNLKGEVVGVNTAIFSPSGGSVGIGFAIASNLVKEVIADLEDDGKVERGWLGVQIQALDEDLATSLELDKPRGALVSDVPSGSPAEEAGVRRGDVVLSFDGKPIDKVGQLSRAVAEAPAGKTAEIVVWRDGKEKTLEATIAAMPTHEQAASNEQESKNPDQPKLGLVLAPLTPEQRQRLGIDADIKGVLVAQVMPGEPAEAKDIEPGDIILSVDHKEVRRPQDVSTAIREAHEEGRKAVLLLISRDGAERFEAIPLATS